MKLLYALAALRTPLLDAFFSLITRAGEEAVFLLVGLFLLWCVRKRTAFYLFMVCFLNLICNQILKTVFRAPRPWEVDPDFQIVESAREIAIGYSFPSGHTQNIIGICGCAALGYKKRWLRIVCAVLAVVVPFSRLYLGVHFLQDVLGGLLISAVLVLVLYPAFSDERRFAGAMPILLGIQCVLSIGLLVVLCCTAFSQRLDAGNRASAVNQCCQMLGAIPALFLIWFLDYKWLHYSEKAPLLGQVLKMLLGLIGVYIIKDGTKAPLQALLGQNIGDGVRMFFLIFFAGFLWPLTFPLFARLGRKKECAE